MNNYRNTKRWLLVAALSACMLPVQTGCRRLRKPPEFTALAQPTTLTVPASAAPAKAEPQGVAGKAKAAAAATAKFAGVVVLGVVVFGLGLWFDDDDDEDSDRFDPDPLWREGYGYNNPNNERIREGKPVLNFDGSVAD